MWAKLRLELIWESWGLPFGISVSDGGWRQGWALSFGPLHIITHNFYAELTREEMRRRANLTKEAD